jgi:hypothetical protein
MTTNRLFISTSGHSGLQTSPGAISERKQVQEALVDLSHAGKAGPRAHRTTEAQRGGATAIPEDGSRGTVDGGHCPRLQQSPAGDHQKSRHPAAQYCPGLRSVAARYAAGDEWRAAGGPPPPSVFWHSRDVGRSIRNRPVSTYWSTASPKWSIARWARPSP